MHMMWIKSMCRTEEPVACRGGGLVDLNRLWSASAPTTQTSVLPSADAYALGSRLNCEVSALYEAGGVVPVTNGFGHVVVSGLQGFGVIDGGGSFLLEWVASSDVDARKAALIKYQNFRDDMDAGSP